MKLNFINGKATIKQGKKIVAKVYYRPDFFRGLNVSYNEKKPYALEINGMGAECENLQEVEELLYSEL